jgi:hypothetical protein
MKQAIWNRAGKPPAQIEILSKKGAAAAADTHCSSEAAQTAGTTWW